MATRILIVDDDPNLARVARDVLRPQGLDVRAADQAGAAMALVRLGVPALVLVSLDMAEGLRFVELLRAYPQGGERVQVIGSTARGADAQRELRRTLRALRVSRVIARPFSLLDLPQVVAEVLSETPPPEEPVARRRVHPDTLRELARIWREEDSGVASTASGLAGRFREGGLADADTIAFVDQVLREGLEIGFRRCALHGERRSELLAERLWQAARQGLLPELPPEWLRAPVAPSLWLERLEELPVSPGVLRVVRAADSASTLSQLLAALGLREEPVAVELLALHRLGLLELLPGGERLRAPGSTAAGAGPARAAPEAGSSRLTAPRPEPPPPEPPRPEPLPPPTRRLGPTMDPTQALLLLKRLRREEERLTGADPFVVLGVPYSADPQRVHAAAERMRARYSEVLSRRDVSDEVHRLARLLVEGVGRAEAGALGAEAPAPVTPLVLPTSENESRAFQAGLDALRRRDWPQAVRAFRAAHHSRVDAPEYMAHLGWALFNDRSRGPSRLGEALELLELAESFAPDHAETQLWLGEVELESGHADRAQARALRLVRRGALGAQAQELAERARVTLLPPERA